MSRTTLKGIVDSLYQGEPPKGSSLRGKSISIPNLTAVFVAVDTQERLHLLIPTTKEKLSSKLLSISLKSLRCEKQSWIVEATPKQDYIDLSCDSAAEELLRAPFIAFCEDIIDELRDEGTNIEETIHSVYRKWRKFWALPHAARIKREWVRGLFAELEFLARMIAESGSKSVELWTGPNAGTWDFTGSDTAVEIKSCSMIPPNIRVNNLAQLDCGRIGTLYLCVCIMIRTEEGETLPVLVRRIESLLQNAEGHLETFWTLLATTGYRRELEGHYSAFSFQVEEFTVFKVDNDFPKITSDMLSKESARRVSKVRYNLDLDGIDYTDLDSTLFSKISHFSKRK